MVRAIATGDLKATDWAAALIKENPRGILMGCAMGGLAFLVGWLYGGESSIAQVIGLSMLAIVLVANLFGALLPFALDRIDIDPAVASSPPHHFNHGCTRADHLFLHCRVYPLRTMDDSNTQIQTLKDRILAFAEERDWEQFHSPKNLSMAIAAEAAELMEHFLWQSAESSRKEVLSDPLREKILKKSPTF